MSQTEQETTPHLDTVPSIRRRPARVNLLPPEIGQARRLRQTQVGLAAGLTVLMIAIGGGYALQVRETHQVQDDLAEVQARTVRLRAEQDKYADVPRTIAAIDAAETARSAAMAKDVEWFRTLNNFSLTLPTNVWFTGLQMQITPDAAAGSAPAAGPVAGPATGAIGSLTVQGSALDHPDVATWLDVLARQPGMGNAYFSNSAKSKIGSKVVVTFTSTASLTDAARSHRYDRKQG